MNVQTSKCIFRFLAINSAAVLVVSLALFKDQALERYYLIKLQNTKDQLEKILWFEKLADIGSRRAIPLLMDLLKENYEQVGPLGFCGHSSSEEIRQGTMNWWREFWRGRCLVKIGYPAAPELFNALNSSATWYPASTALIEIAKQDGSHRNEILMKMISHSNFDVAMEGARGFRFADVSILPALLDAIESAKNEDQFCSSLMAVQSMGPKAEGAVRKLIDLLKHENGEAQRGAAMALGAIGPMARPALPHLLERCNNSSPWWLKSAI